MEKHRSKFGENFADNKKALDQISIVRSKLLKNEVAGYITKFIKKELENQKRKEMLVSRSSGHLEEEIQDPDVIKEEIDSESESMDIEPETKNESSAINESSITDQS